MLDRSQLFVMARTVILKLVKSEAGTSCASFLSCGVSFIFPLHFPTSLSIKFPDTQPAILLSCDFARGDLLHISTFSYLSYITIPKMASYLPKAVTEPLAQGADFLRSTLGGISWGPAVSVSKAAVVSLFNRIEIGQLIVRDETTGQTAVYGQKIAKEHSRKSNGVNGINGVLTNGVNGHKKTTTGVRRVELSVKKDAFWVRLFLFADMGFAEAYMLGDVECEDLTSFFEVCSDFSKKLFGADFNSCSL